MLSKINIKNLKKINDFYIIIFFTLISLLSALILFRSQIVNHSDDLSFNWGRICEIRSEGLFSKVALNKFIQDGSAVMSLYPKLNLLPIVVLSLFVKSFYKIIYITFMLRNFVSLVISYYACYSYTKKKSTSVIFSCTYTLSAIVLDIAFVNMDFGITTSIMFLPMVLFGFMCLKNDNKWKELAIGISFIATAHVINFIISVLFVLILLLFNLELIKKKEFVFSFVKAIIVSMLLTSISWMPFVFIYFDNNISMPLSFTSLNGYDFNNLLSVIFNNDIRNVFINIFALFGFILAIANYNKMNKEHKQMFWIAAIFLFVCSSLFPWNILNSTFLKNTLQMPWRLLIVSQLLLCYIFAEFSLNISRRYNKLNFVICIILSLVMLMQFSDQKKIVDLGRQNPINITNVNYFNNPSNGQLYYSDYMPDSSLSLGNQIQSNYGVYDKNKTIKLKLLGNGKYAFMLNHNVDNFSMPFVIYNNIHYQVKVDGNIAKFHTDQYSRLTINHLHKGKHIIQVIVHKSWYDYLSYVLSALGVIILAFAGIRSLILKRKNKE